MQPLTEETGQALVLAMRDLTEAIKRGHVQNASVSDGAYVARSVLGGPDAAIAENKRARTARRSSKK
jgi:hypothetical protein